MRRFVVFIGVLLAVPVWGKTTQEDELASHLETGGMGESVLRFHPFIETAYQYDDNINFLEEGGQANHQFIVRPGFSTVWSNHENTYLELMYQLEVEEFLHNTNLDTLNHLVDAKADWNWEPLYLFAREHYLNTNDRSYTTLTQLIQRQDDQQNLTLGMQKNELTFELQSEHFNRVFEDQLTEFNYSRYGLSPNASWDWTESQRMLADIGWYRDVYTNDPTRTGQDLQSHLGWEYHPTDAFKTHVLGGYETRHFDGVELNDFHGFVGEWMFNVTRLYDRGHLQGGYRRSAQESISDSGSGYYLENLFTTSFSYDVTSKVVPAFNVSWARQKYGNTQVSSGFSGQRNDDVTNVGVQIKYAFSEQFSIVPGYRFQHRASNVPLQNYNDNTVTLTCRYAL